jgi:hypothetical protein
MLHSSYLRRKVINLKSQEYMPGRIQPLTTKRIEFTEEAFKPINPEIYKFHLTEMESHHAATVSKKSASKRECTVIIPRDENMGSRFGMCTCGYPKKEGIPC